MNNLWHDAVNKVYCALQFDRKVVGIRLLRTEDDYKASDASELRRPINYCHMILAATHGSCIKAKEENFRCKSGVRVLGINPADPKNSQGENWTRLGLYNNAEVSKKVRDGLVYLKEPCFGVQVAPIEKFNDFPDVIMFIVNPYNAMRIIQGYAHKYGMPESVNMIGNQAVCLECTARPYGVKDINVSMLCIGTRHRAGWKDEEMAIGVPKEQFADIADGLMNTINQMENDKNKKIIERKLEEKGIPFSIRYGHNYYMDC